jgi:hypothetical protein
MREKKKFCSVGVEIFCYLIGRLCWKVLSQQHSFFEERKGHGFIIDEIGDLIGPASPSLDSNIKNGNIQK